MGFSAFFTSIGLWKSRGQLYYFSQRFAMAETKLRLATRAPPVISISPVNPCDLPGFFMSAKPPCLQVVRTKITTSRPPFGRFPSGGLFAFQTPVSADFSLTCGQKVHTPCRGQQRHVTSPLPPLVFIAPKPRRELTPYSNVWS